MTVTINGTTGITTPGLTNDGSQTITGGTANGVAYLNGSKVLTTGSALTFDGSNLGLGVTPSAWVSSKKVFQFGAVGAIGSDTATVSLSNNVYYNTGGNPIYIANGYATYNYQNSGQYVWLTAPSGTAGNAISFTQAMTLDASGNLQVGLSSSYGQLTQFGYYHAINTANSSGFDIGLLGGSGSADAYVYQRANAALVFGTNNTERMRINASGSLLVGTTANGTNSPKFRVVSPSTWVAEFAGNNAIICTAEGTAGFAAYFQTSGTTLAGYIYTNGSNTSFATSSDYRLKENIQPMQNALATISKLNPVTYNWKADGSDGQGFIAHELQAVVPDCVTGEKDAVDKDGNPVYQGIDTSFLVGILTKAVQELTARIEQLEAK